MNFDPTLSFNISRKMMPLQNGVRLNEGPEGPGLMFGNLSIHDSKNPIAEAEQWLKKADYHLLKNGNEPSMALVFGLGLAYHLKALRQRYPEIEILVFEPISEIKKLYDSNKVSNWPGAAAPLIFTNWLEFEKTVSQKLVYGNISGCVSLTPAAYKTLKPEAFGAFESFIKQELIRRAVIERTRESSDTDFLKNLALNAAYLSNYPDLMLLKGLLPPRPAIIVGSGPSLEKNVHLLKNIASKALIFAAASALKPLLAHGVSPDLVLVLESSDTSTFLDLKSYEKDILGENKILALASSSHPAHFKVKNFIKTIFHLSEGAAQIFSKAAFLPQGGNAGSAAFALAYACGLEPLILLGQDQAYEGGRLHADGTPGTTVDKASDSISVNAIGGGAVETHSGLLASLGWFAEAARTINEKDKPPLLYNCSASGANVPGFTEADLSSVLAGLTPPDETLDLPALVNKIPKTSALEIKDDIEQLAALVGGLRRLARMDYRKAFNELQEVCKISKFLKQILAEASAATGRNELQQSLNKADELISLMLSSLL